MPNQLYCTQTDAVAAGRGDLRELSGIAPPIDLSATNHLRALGSAVADLGRWAEGDVRGGNPIYARVYNPTVARFEQAMADLEGGADAVAFSSGVAAAVLVRDAAEPDTRAGRHRRRRRPSRAGTRPRRQPFATPVLQRPLAHGATFAWHSATKFVGGHGDVVGGVVVTDAGWAGRLRQLRFMTGALLHPLAAYLAPSRHRHFAAPCQSRPADGESAGRPPRLPSRGRAGALPRPRGAGSLVGGQMAGPGAMIAIDLGSHARAAAFIERVSLAAHAVSLGTFETLVEHPASLTHGLVDEDARGVAGISGGLVRLAIGLEDVDDLWPDFAAALELAERADEHTSVVARKGTA